MRVPYNDRTKDIYETVARIAREIAEKERSSRNESTEKARGAY